MPETSATDAFDRRLPLYAYLEPLFAGRRVLELGCGSGAGAIHIAGHGAARVLAIDTDAAAVERARARQAHENLELRAVGSLLDPQALGEAFDVIVVPEGEELLRRSESAVESWKRALAPGGRLVIAATSADRGGTAAGRAEAAGGVGYYELADGLAAVFPRVQMFSVTPFAGFGMVEFDGGAEPLRVDSRLVDAASEVSAPHAYLAVAGDEPAEGLGYALVQLPFGPIEARLAGGAAEEERGAPARLAASERRLEEAERRARARVEEAEGRIADLRRKLDDAGAQSESAMRVARAQGEEIEELRGRLRRAAEDRAALDGEIAKLRRALAEADESVMSLTRRTAEEMSAVAQRLAAGLREMEPPRERSGELTPAREEAERLRVALAETEARASAAEQRLEEIGTEGRERQASLDDALERLRMAEDAIARERREVSRLQAETRAAAEGARTLEQRQAALAARDERIARLEGEKQDLVWRLAELEEKLREAIARAVVADGAKVQSDDLVAARAGRERAMEEFRRAAETHVGEVTQLRGSLSEQTALAAELEDAVKAAEGRAATATAEAAVLRKNAKTLEEADRTRRSRLAELEGKLLRLEHERKAAAAAAAAAAARGREDREAAERRVAPPAPPAPHNGHDPMLKAAARELDAVQATVAEEMQRLRDIERALGEVVSAIGAEPSPSGEAAEASLLEARVANYRRLAARLRDELEGIRRRWDSLSPAEISGYLDELGDDLAEMEG